ncbi:MAG: amidohydrolase family protein [candidate division Zixibacteria bacterium]|nr:amidohydrolase family protein [candidate division Zixibacteria bacterium]
MKKTYIVSAIFLIASTVFAQSEQPQKIEPGSNIRGELNAGEIHNFQVELKSGQYILIAVRQIGVDLVVKVNDPNGELVSEIDSPTGDKGTELVELVPTLTGLYELQLSSLLEDSAKGEYEIKILKSRSPKEQNEYTLAKIARRESGFAIENVRVFDGESVYENTTVIFQNGKITAIGSDIDIPEKVEVISGEGRTLLPGLIESHSHIAAASALEQALAFGVTTAMGMHEDPVAVSALKSEQSEGKAFGRADIFSAGNLVTAPKGHGTEYGRDIPTIERAEDAQKFVDERIAEGSDYIKIVYQPCEGCMPSIDYETLEALIKAAHKRNKLAIVHIHPLEFAEGAVKAGADGLAHMFADHVPDSAFVEQMSQQNTFVIVTLGVTYCFGGGAGGEALATDYRVAPYLDAPAAEWLAITNPNPKPGGWFDPDTVKISLKLLHDKGIRLLAGSDPPNRGTAFGISVHREMDILVEAGLSPLEALKSATSLPASVFNLTDRGRIGVGLRADLLLVEGDPTTDIDKTRNIVAIWKEGELFDRDFYREKKELVKE